MNDTTLTAWRRRFGVLLIAWLLGIGLADWLFYRHPLGCNVGLFAAFLLAVLLVRDPGATERPAGFLLSLALAGLAVALVIDVGVIAVLLTLAGLPLLTMTARGGWTWRFWAWVARWGKLAVIGWLQLFRDARLWRRWRRHARVGGRARGPTWVDRWFPPIMLTLLFVGLFAIANPVIAQWCDRFGGWLGDLLRCFPDLGPARIFLWLVTAFATWALYRLHYPPAPPPVPAPDEPLTVSLGPSRFPGFLVRSLVLFNAVFLVQNLLDLSFLWRDTPLPAGLTHAEYAHRGAYPLVATALLAALFVLVTFSQRHGRAPEMQWPRRLVYLWLAQNVILTAGAMRRLDLYVEAFTLTRLRVAAAVWMLLVAIGLGLIVWRLWRHRDNWWLVRANVLVLVGVLYVGTFVDCDGLIAAYNVRHCAEVRGSGPDIDLRYLSHLGPEALPALLWLADQLRDGPVADACRQRAANLRARLAEPLADWRGWTWQRARLAELLPVPAPTPVTHPRNDESEP